MYKTKELIIILILIGFFAYLPSFFGGFVWDDEDFVYNNTYVQQFEIPRFFTQQAIAGAGKISNYYRPVQFTLYSILYKAAGPSPFLFHLAGVLLHITAAVLAYIFLLKLTDKNNFSFLTSLFFLIHPVQTESVSYISGASDALYTIFFFLSLIFFLRFIKSHNIDNSTEPKSVRSETVIASSKANPTPKFREGGLKSNGRTFYSILSIGFFVLSLLSKELALMLPGIAILIVLFERHPDRVKRAKGSLDSVKLSLTALGMTGVAAIYLISRFTFLKFYDISLSWKGTQYGAHFTTRLATFFHNFFTYVQLLIFPKDLFMERDFTIQIHTSLGNMWTFAFIAVNAIIISVLYKRKTISLFFYLSFLLTLLPYTGIFLLNGIFYEHYLYLPMLFFWGFIFSMVSGKGYRNIITYTVIAVSVIFVLRSWSRQWEWINEERFYRQTLQHAPQSLRIMNGLGMALAQKHECPEAIKTYHKAIRLDPRIPNPYHNIANCYQTMGEYKNAEGYYLKAIAVSPRFYFSYRSLLALYIQTNQKEKAKKLITEKMLPLFPESEELRDIFNSLSR